jgi:hypothetical protein
MKKVSHVIITFVLIETVFILLVSYVLPRFVLRYFLNNFQDWEQVRNITAVLSLFGFIFILIIAMRILVRLKSYKPSYLGSLAVCFFICLLPLLISRIIMRGFRFSDEDFMRFGMLSLIIAGISVLVAAFFYQSKYVPGEGDLIDEEEIGKR